MKIIDGKYLKENPNHIFVFGDNTCHRGKAGAAKYRDFPNTYGFITKIKPDMKPSSFFDVEEYQIVYQYEISKLRNEILNNPDKHYLISKLGSGLANKYGIYQEVIEPNIRKDLSDLHNVEFLWSDGEDE